MENIKIDTTMVKNILGKHKTKMKFYLGMCAHCSLCAESCFLFNSHDKDPKYMPSYKFINSIGTLYKKKGKINNDAAEEIKANIWERCALCTRCYCPFGIDIPSMIALARNVMRSQGIYPHYDE